MSVWALVFVFLFGLCVGSFLNVCIHRIPRDESIIFPGSRCPACRHPLAWYDNIPLVSFLLLRGKCRYCAATITPRYIFVELVTGLLFVTLGWHYGWTAMFVISVLLGAILLAVSIIDFETGLIPDKFTFPGMALGLVASALYPKLHHVTVWYQGLLHSGVGLVVGGGSLLAIGLLGNFIYRRESMGGGDIKLLAMLGAFLGMKKVILVLLFAPLVSLPIALYQKFFVKAETIPFGPYLALTGAWFFLYGENVVKYFFVF